MREKIVEQPSNKVSTSLKTDSTFTDAVSTSLGRRFGQLQDEASEWPPGGGPSSVNRGAY